MNMETLMAKQRNEKRSDKLEDEAAVARALVDDFRAQGHDVDLAYSADTVRKLNEREGYARYREIPLRDLNP